ncbi:unnamed protein product [Paramecium octaurelia]|uniref:BolA-like protein 3 n=1 Tax=Paramecium octaurelia TaxID=43137 RepID=A0A8S1UER9_PAROT|nr:unnamed protein product [Paramecium octaurelia]
MLRKLFFSFSQDIEKVMADKLTQVLKATKVEVIDTSGGCGSMYRLEIESPEFQGKSKVKQHQMVVDALKAELAGAHGYSIKTNIPK